MIRDLIALENTSKVWIYQAEREFNYDELDAIRPKVFDFLADWTSHNQALVTYGNIFHKRFLGIFVDESLSGASGCSIDKSVHFVESLGAQFNVNFFRRDVFCYLNDEDVIALPIGEVKEAYSKGEINEETLFFDNLVKDKEQFLKSWLVPLKDSWHKRFI
jgi:hypothetical protein